MDAARKPVLGDATNAPQQPFGKSPPPRAAALLPPAPPAGPPALPASARVLFARIAREEIKAENPDWNLGMVGRELSQRWEALDDDAKRPFLERAAADKERYDREKAAYDAANQPAPVVAENVPSNEAPQLRKPAKRPATDISVATEGVVLEVDEETHDAALLTTGADGSQRFADAMAYARDYQNLDAALRMTELDLETVVRAVLPQWNPDNEYAFGGALMRAVHDLHFNGVQTVAQLQEAAKKPRPKRRRGPPRKGERSSPRLQGQPPLSLADEVDQAALDAPPSLADHDNGIGKRGRPDHNAGKAWGNAITMVENAAKYVECKEGTKNNPGPAVDGAEEWLADEVPEACLGYPDYAKKRGANMFIKGNSASAFYKKNGYWRIAVFGGHHGNSSKAVFKFFKEVARA